MDYSFGLFIRMCSDYIKTKIFYRKARLIRFPIFIRGKKGFFYTKGFTTGRNCRIESSNKKTTLIIGENARIGDYVHICAEENVTIGKNVLIASKAFISDTSHGNYTGMNQTSPLTNPSERPLFSKKISIGDNVWIGENVVILAGVKVGNGCIIGANSFLSNKEYPDYSIIVGTPAKVIKTYNFKTNKWERC